MIFSKEQMFSEGQVVAANGASDNVIDLGAAGTVLGAPAPIGRDIGKGRPIPIWISLDADPGGTNPTLDVALEVDDNEAFSTPKTVASAQQLAPGAAGDRVAIFYVPQGADERYMRLNYTVGGTSPSYTVTAGIVLAAPQER